MHTGESDGGGGGFDRDRLVDEVDLGTLRRSLRTNVIDVQDMSERYWMIDTRPSTMSVGPQMYLGPHLPERTAAVIVSVNKGRGRKPYRLILPGQLYLKDVVEQLETGAHNVEVYPVLLDQPWIEVARRVR